MSQIDPATGLITILVFTLIVIGIESYLILQSPHDDDDESWDHDNIVRFLGLTLIVAAILILVVLRPSPEYLAAVVGVLGTLAGYFLRPADKRDDEKDEKPEEPAEEEPVNSNSTPTQR